MLSQRGSRSIVVRPSIVHDRRRRSLTSWHILTTQVTGSGDMVHFLYEFEPYDDCNVGRTDHDDEYDKKHSRSMGAERRP